MSSRAVPVAVEPPVSARSRLLGKLRLRHGLMGATLGTVALNVTSAALMFVVTVALTRLLGAQAYGAYAFAFAFATMLSVPGVLGLTPLIVRNIAGYRERSAWGLFRGMLRRATQVALVTSVGVSGAAAVLGWLLLDRDGELLQPFWVGLLMVPLLSLVTVRQAAMQGLGRVVSGRLPETIVAPGLLLILLLGVAAATEGPSSASAAVALQVVAIVVAFVLGGRLLRRATPSDARVAKPAFETRAWLTSGLSLLAVSAVLALNNQLGVIVVGAVEGGRETGVFAASTRVALLVSFLYVAVSYPLMPAVAALRAAGRTVELQRSLSRAAGAVALASLPVAALFVVLAPQLLDIFGQGFDEGVTTLRILVAAEVVKVVTGFAGLVLLMCARERQWGMWVVAGTALNFVACLALVPGLGAEGAALAAVLSATLMNLGLVFSARRTLGVWTPSIGRPSVPRATEPR